MPDEGLISQIENILAEVVNLGGRNELSSIVPNLTVQDANPTGLDGFVIVSDDRDGDNITAKKVGSVIYSDNDLVNVMFLQGAEAIAFQQGSQSANSGIWEIVPGTSTDIFYNKGDVGIGKSVAPDAALEILDTAQQQLRLTFQEDTKFVDFTLDTNHDLTITPSSTGQIILQPTTDQTNSVQILDADGGTPVFNADLVNERIGIGTATPNLPLSTIFDDGVSSGSHDIGEFSDILSGAAKRGVILGYEANGAAATAGMIRVPNNSDLVINPTGGDVGIGTSSPGGGTDAILTIRQDNATHNSNTIAYVQAINRVASDTGAWYFGADTSNNAILVSNNSAMIFGKDFGGTFTEGMRLTVDGDLGIGISPTNRLEIAESAVNTTAEFGAYSVTDTHSPILLLQKSASATVGTLSQTADGERLGAIRFAGVDTGSNSEIAASIRGVQDGAAGTRVAGKLEFYLAPDNSNPIALQMTLDATGLGINQSSPASKLDILGPNSSVDIFRTIRPGSASDGTGQGWTLRAGSSGTSGSGMIFRHVSNNGAGVETLRNFIRFYDTGITLENDSATVLAVFENAGNIGFNGVTSPSTEFDIGAGAIEFEEMTAPAAGAANTARDYAEDDGSGNTRRRVKFSSGNAVTIAQDGGLATYTPTNVVTDRSYDANATSVAELADVLGTLIADFQAAGVLA